MKVLRVAGAETEIRKVRCTREEEKVRVQGVNDPARFFEVFGPAIMHATSSGAITRRASCLLLAPFPFRRFFLFFFFTFRFSRAEFQPEESDCDGRAERRPVARVN